MPKRTPSLGAHPQPSLPHDPNREGVQPYATEIEAYETGVAKPPKSRPGLRRVPDPRKAVESK
jgi:hypothetical protein